MPLATGPACRKRSPQQSEAQRATHGPQATRFHGYQPSLTSTAPLGQAVDVPALDVEVAADFLAARTTDQDLLAATQLAEESGGLPLALEQAGVYIQASGAAWPAT